MTPIPTAFRYHAKAHSCRVLPTGRKEIEKLAQQYIDEIRGKASGAETSKQLYERLLKPIPEISSADRILIAPDGILNLLPFEALQDSQWPIPFEVAHYKLRAFRHDFGYASPRPKARTRAEAALGRG